MPTLKNTKHEKFCQIIASGKSGTDAYFSVYNTKSRNVARISADRLLTNPTVRARVKELQEENARVFALSRAEKRDILAEIARNTELSAKERIQAIQEDNRMTGDAEEQTKMPTFNINFVP